MNTAKEFWYEGKFAEYRELPWLHNVDFMPMPWRVLDVQPCGYVVFQSATGNKFKMFLKPAICVGDTIS